MPVKFTPAIAGTDDFTNQSQAFAMLVDKLDAPAAGRPAKEALDVLAVCPDPRQQGALARMFDAILPKATFEEVLAIYRNYQCRERLERSALRALGAYLGRPAPFEGRWNLVSWLETHGVSSSAAGKAYEALQGPLVGPNLKTDADRS
jgi:hypothetical protein